MSKSLFNQKPPKEYTLTELTWEQWVKGLYKDVSLSAVSNKNVIIRRADSALQRFLDKARSASDRDAVYLYMTGEIGEVELMNRLDMTKLQRAYLWPLLPSITGFIGENVSERELKVMLHKFYIDAMTGDSK